MDLVIPDLDLLDQRVRVQTHQARTPKTYVAKYQNMDAIPVGRSYLCAHIGLAHAYRPVLKHTQMGRLLSND